MRDRDRGSAISPAIIAVVWVLAAPAAAAAWTLALADSATVNGTVVRIADLVCDDVPAAVADVIVSPAGRPGRSARISRQMVLRRLVAAGQADGVRCIGAASCHVTFVGATLNARAIAERVEALIRALLPPPPTGAPSPWTHVELPDLQLAVGSAWEVALDAGCRWEPGRNLVPIRVSDGRHNYRFSATVTLHTYGEIARPAQRIARGTPLQNAPLVWEWCDLAMQPAGIAVGRDAILDHSAARDLEAGKELRTADLKPTPLIAAGEPVELRCGRGRVAATVRAVARQPGRLGQIISVRNELTGRLVSARVAGPALVEWSR